MGFAWREYLTLATELAERSEQEAALRTAISRAYYAVFCTARARLAEPSLGTAHRGVWDAYRNAGDRNRRSIGNRGDRLRRLRQRADYDAVFPGLAGETKRVLYMAAELLDELDKLPIRGH